MKSFEKLLVCIEPTGESADHQQSALARLTQLSHQQPLHVVLAACIYYPSIEDNFILDPENMNRVKTSMLQQHKNRIHDLIRQYDVKHVSLEIDVIWHHANHLGLLTLIDKHQPDCVLKSNHRHGKLESLFMNSTDSQLLRACPSPIWFTKSASLNNASHVLACVDPGNKLNQKSAVDERVLESAYRVSQHLKTSCHACHFFDPNYWQILLEAVQDAQIWTDVFPVAPETEPGKVLDNLRDQHNKMFRQACEAWVPDSANQHCLDGEVGESVAELIIRLNVGVLVIGTAYRTGLMGSTAASLLDNVRCDVLVVKGVDFASPFASAGIG